jgi:flagellar basal-body rod protein FlgB
MLPQVLQSTTIPALAEVVSFAQARHEVLAGNIANANTPGYRTRDLSLPTFQAQLKEMIEATYKKDPPRTEHYLPDGTPLGPSPGHVDVEQDKSLTEVRKSLTNLLYHDDTNIDLEKQVAEISKNQMLHSMALTIMANQFQLMQVAISERV